MENSIALMIQQLLDKVFKLAALMVVIVIGSLYLFTNYLGG